MSAIDRFVNDVFDVDSTKVSGISEIVSGSSIKFDALLRSSATLVNLAFHESWKAATIGSHPTRLDYEAFVANLPGSNPSSGLVWSEATANALVASLYIGTHVRIHPQQTKLFQAAAETYQRVLASLANTGAAGAKRLLFAKLADRFGCDANQPESAAIISVYASFVLADPYLKDLEKWANDSNDSSSNDSALYVPPKSVTEYYDRVSSAANRLNLPFRNPITSLYMDLGFAPGENKTTLSALELLRLPISRDGHLWRRDSGGSLLILGSKMEATLKDVVAHPGFKFRTVRGIPLRYLYDALPPLLYARVVVAPNGSDSSDSFPLIQTDPRDLVKITTNEASEASEASEDTSARTVLFSRTAPAHHERYWLPLRDSPLGIEIAVSVLSAHLQKPCPLRAISTNQANLQQAGALGGDLLYHKFVTRYIDARNLYDRVFNTAADGVGKTGEVVLVDNRVNVWSITSILITLDNLRVDVWAVSVFCSSANHEFFKAHLLPRVPHARIEVLESLNKTPFDIETYNGILKSPAFWSKIRSPRALVIQDDGILIRPGLDDDREILSQDFVGAPWIDVPDNRKMLETAGVGSGLIGNGGFSLRNTRVMQEVSAEDGDSRYGRATFCMNVQPVPEDVFYSAAMNRRGRSCAREIAERFAFEEKISQTHTPFGFHKPWPYNNPIELSKFFDRIIEGLSAPTDLLAMD